MFVYETLIYILKRKLVFLILCLSVGFVAFALGAEGTVIVLNHLVRTCCVHFLTFTFVPQYNQGILPHRKTECDPIYFLKNIYVLIWLSRVLVAAGRIFSCSRWYLDPGLVQGLNLGPCLGNTESQPLKHQESPSTPFT